MIRRSSLLALPSLLLGTCLFVAACGGAPIPATPGTTPAPAIRVDATPEEIARQWGRAERDFRRGKWADAVTELERVSLEFPAGDERIPLARFYLGESHLMMKSHLQAVREFRRVSDEMPSHPLASEALLRAADAFGELWRRPELDPTYAMTALGTYQEVLNRYPGTHAARLAQVRIADINDKLADKQYRTAQYYIKYKAYDSAILYLKDLASTYPRARVTPEALLTLIGVYQRLGYTEDVRETCVYIRRFHAAAAGVAAACPDAAATPAAPAPGGAR